MFQAANNIDPGKLTITEPIKYEVPNNPCFRQYIRHKGGKLLLHTAKFHMQDIVIRDHGTFVSTLVPVEGWLRAQLNVIEQFACQNVTIPVTVTNNKQTGRLYKPLFRNGNMYITISHWCSVLKLNRETGTYDSVSLTEMTGKGVYYMTIEVPYIYIGNHKTGESFSVTLRVVEMYFEPEAVASPLIQLTSTPTNPEMVGRHWQAQQQQKQQQQQVQERSV